MIIRTEAERIMYRELGRIHATIMDGIRPLLVVGATGLEIDAKVGELCVQHNVQPAFKGIYGFPGNLCISINDWVVHGIPDNTPFKQGDVVKIDFGLRRDGYNTDAAFTVQIGEPKDPEVERFLQTCQECLERGVAQAVAGKRLGDIGYAIQSHAEAMGYHIVRELTGHGVGMGENLHDDPHVLNYGKPGQGQILTEGMLLAIEPILGFSSGKMFEKELFHIFIADGSLGAHFENLVIVGKDKPEILV